MTAEILSPIEKLYSGEVYLVQVPGSKGSFEVLENHAPVISNLDQGKIKVIAKDGQVQYFEIKKGFIEVKNNEIKILVNQ